MLYIFGTPSYLFRYFLYIWYLQIGICKLEFPVHHMIWWFLRAEDDGATDLFIPTNPVAYRLI